LGLMGIDEELGEVMTQCVAAETDGG
jgi:hypothetical protein